LVPEEGMALKEEKKSHFAFKQKSLYITHLRFFFKEKKDAPVSLIFCF